MSTTAALHSEWIKIRATRSVLGSLLAVLGVTVGLTVVACAAFGEAESDNADFDPLFTVFYGLNFGQIAALAYGTTAVSGEYHGGAIRVSLAAVPRRRVFYAAKLLAVGGPALAVGLVTGLAGFLAGGAFLGGTRVGLGDPGAVRAVVGSGIYLALMALLAAGLTMLLRSGVAVLSLLIPFLLIVSFVVGDLATGAARFLPDRAGQLVLHTSPDGGLDPWAGLAVTACWAAAAVLAGWWRLERDDA
ncbi:ABC transporter permease [Streptomyces sp. NPDC018031]|uniref:ABC transporter permease n=1 Tax=Streptomyces sp. NPDC018031 TaxID=3365033 RepID=UPI003795F209